MWSFFIYLIILLIILNNLTTNNVILNSHDNWWPWSFSQIQIKINSTKKKIATKIANIKVRSSSGYLSSGLLTEISHSQAE